MEQYIKDKAREYGETVHGLTRKKTAPVDFEKGAMFIIKHFGWRDTKGSLPPLNELVLVKRTGKFVNIGMLVYSQELKKEVWLCGNSNKAWDIDFWMPLPK